MAVAEKAVQYEYMFDAQQRPFTLHQHLRHIWNCLQNIEPASIPDHKMATREPKAVVEAYYLKAGPALRVVYRELLAFAEDVENYVKPIKEDNAKIPREWLQ